MIFFLNDSSGFLKKFRIKGPRFKDFERFLQIHSCFRFLKIFKESNWFNRRISEKLKLWGLHFLTNSFGFLRSIIMSKNQSFDFMKIINHGSIILGPYLSVHSLKKKKIRQCFVLANLFFKMAKI